MHTQATIERTRAVETATGIRANHIQHSLDDALELHDLQELVRIAQERQTVNQRLDLREATVMKRLWERNKTEDQMHQTDALDALELCQMLDGDKRETPQVSA